MSETPPRGTILGRRRFVSGAALAALGLPGAHGCGRPTGVAATLASAAGTAGPVAVLPVENLSAKRSPLDDVRQALVERLQASGFRVLGDEALERSIARHRVRYLGGVEHEFARALGRDAGVKAIVLPSLETYDEVPPFRAALFARLISSGDAPALLWADGWGAAGDDAPGILGLGLVEDPRVLLARAVDALARSLAAYVAANGGRIPGETVPPKFRPKIVYRSDLLEPGRPYSIAVVPFFNKSARRYAGEIVALHMIRALAGLEGLRVVEPGFVREALLRFRIIMSDGISLPDTETVLGATSADLVLNGEVLDYDDPRGAYGAPRVDLSVLFIERRGRRLVYSSYSSSAGDDGVFFFDVGRVNTAHAMAAQMARAIAERVRFPAPPGEPPPARQPGQEA